MACRLASAEDGNIDQDGRIQRCCAGRFRTCSRPTPYRLRVTRVVAHHGSCKPRLESPGKLFTG